MKHLLVILIFFSFLNCFSQFQFDSSFFNQKENYKVKKIHDSINNVMVYFDIIGVDWEDNNKPAVYKVTMVDDKPKKYYQIIISNSLRSSRVTYVIPPKCQYWKKRDSTIVYKNKVKNYGMMGGGGYVPDSTLTIDEDCVTEFYKNSCDTIHTDTLWSNEHFYEFFTLWECEYDYELKHGSEIAYYSIKELKSTIITGENPRLKHKGSWYLGEKDKYWYYYNKQGVLIKKEKYKKGKLKKMWSY